MHFKIHFSHVTIILMLASFVLAFPNSSTISSNTSTKSATSSSSSSSTHAPSKSPSPAVPLSSAKSSVASTTKINDSLSSSTQPSSSKPKASSSTSKINDNVTRNSTSPSSNTLIQSTTPSNTSGLSTRRSESIRAIRSKVTTDSDWILNSLYNHNELRKLHNVPSLTLNDTLSEIAQAYVNRLLKVNLESLNKRGRVELWEHNVDVLKQFNLGENLFYGLTMLPVDPAFPVQGWYDEIVDYDFETGGRKSTSLPDAMIGHFTQLVWKSTLLMGTAFASGKLDNGQLLTFVAANYYPPGNIRNQLDPAFNYLINVPPPVGWKGNLPNFKLPKIRITLESKMWVERALETNNNIRSTHHAPPLYPDVELCEISQHWANILITNGIRNFDIYGHVGGFPNNTLAAEENVGQNVLYYITDDTYDYDPENTMLTWYDQKRYFDFDRGQKFSNVSPTASVRAFTQMVWKESRMFGFAFEKRETENGQLVIVAVASYYPAQSLIPEKVLENVRGRAVSQDGNSQSYFATFIFLLLTLLL